MKEVTVTRKISDLREIEDWCRRTWGRPGLVWQASPASHWVRLSDQGEVSWIWSFTREDEYVMFTLTWCY
jgi:hypothetical protein